MIDFKNIDFKEIFSHEREDLHLMVFRSWKILLVTFVVILSIFLSIDLYIFNKYMDETIQEPIEKDKLLQIDRTAIDSVVKILDKKAEKFKANLIPPTAKDPSI